MTMNNEMMPGLGLSAKARTFVPTPGRKNYSDFQGRRVQTSSFDDSSMSSDSKSTFSDSSSTGSNSSPSSPQRMFAPTNDYQSAPRGGISAYSDDIFSLPPSGWSPDSLRDVSKSPMTEIPIAKEHRTNSLFHYGNIFLDWGVGKP